MTYSATCPGRVVRDASGLAKLVLDTRMNLISRFAARMKSFTPRSIKRTKGHIPKCSRSRVQCQSVLHGHRRVPRLALLRRKTFVSIDHLHHDTDAQDRSSLMTFRNTRFSCSSVTMLSRHAMEFAKDICTSFPSSSPAILTISDFTTGSWPLHMQILPTRRDEKTSD